MRARERIRARTSTFHSSCVISCARSSRCWLCARVRRERARALGIHFRLLIRFFSISPPSEGIPSIWVFTLSTLVYLGLRLCKRQILALFKFKHVGPTYAILWNLNILAINSVLLSKSWFCYIFSKPPCLKWASCLIRIFPNELASRTFTGDSVKFGFLVINSVIKSK